jgi:transcriptional regulator with XRE-family HTH domain
MNPNGFYVKTPYGFLGIFMSFDSLGERIAHIRGELTQQDFAERLGVSRNTLVRYEKNKRLPSSDFLQLLISDYGADPQWLLMGGEAPKGLNSREAALVANYRASDEDDQRILERTGASFAKSCVEGQNQEDLKTAVWPAGEKNRTERNRK